MTEVINIKDAPRDWKTNPQYVYIGRGGKGLDGFWGNPFPLVDEESRADILKQYISWLKYMEAIHDMFKTKLPLLKDKTLVCFCAPKLCHGNILALLADLT